MTNRVRVLNRTNILIAGLGALLWWFAIATFAVWHGITAQLALPFVGPAEKAYSVATLYLQPGVYMTTSHIITSIVLSLLAGVNIALIMHIRRYRRDILSLEGKTAGLVSMVLMFLGTGCAACGSLVLVSLAAMLGVGVGVSIMPVVGQIVMLAAIVILVHANYRLYQQASNPLVCNIL